MAAFAGGATWGLVLRPSFPTQTSKWALLAAGIWLIVLSLPGELPSQVRAPLRTLLWIGEFVLWIAFDQTGGKGGGFVLHGVASAAVDGVRYSAIADLIGLIIIALLIWARDWPLRAVRDADP